MVFGRAKLLEESSAWEKPTELLCGVNGFGANREMPAVKAELQKTVAGTAVTAKQLRH